MIAQSLEEQSPEELETKRRAKTRLEAVGNTRLYITFHSRHANHDM